MVFLSLLSSPLLLVSFSVPCPIGRLWRSWLCKVDLVLDFSSSSSPSSFAPFWRFGLREGLSFPRPRRLSRWCFWSRGRGRD
ncbi:hypothetical protein BC939DRAFT_455893 [Gamsiella multidivaricata]|uniref:uncharacterized protein n=1 Tax=Gamsiella multidivaricata TaxID=101098 RepID=UPI00221F111A|nr:uncharacterized protein BC939DRAFT_455893 [Gamsiella multidivaricata]KAI7821400.1 hypothetical protein BC939DRAFT_455893 [Gamsiella multidivaricata]